MILMFFSVGGKDAVSSGFGYFMSAAVVLTLCLVTYFMLHKLVSSPMPSTRIVSCLIKTLC